VTDHVQPGSWTIPTPWTNLEAYGRTGWDNLPAPRALMYRGLLVVSHYWEVHREIRQLLGQLEECRRDLPVAAQAADNQQPIDTKAILAAVAATDNDAQAAYLLALLHFDLPPADQALSTLTRKLESTTPDGQRATLLELCRLLSRYDQQAAEAVPLLADRLDRGPDLYVRAAVLQAITKIGAAAAAVELTHHTARIAAQTLNSGAIPDLEIGALLEALIAAGPAAAEAVEPVLKILASRQAARQRARRGASVSLPTFDFSPSNTIDGCRETLAAIDPEGKQCRKVLRQWKESANERNRQLFPVAEEEVYGLYGDP
jgi:hypothetical protein